MLLKKAAIVFLILSAARIVVSCQCDHGPKVVFYRVDSFRSTNLDNSGDVVRETVTNDIPRKAFGLRLSLELKQWAYSENYSLYPAAYAMHIDCPEFEFYPRDTISAISITTLQDFNDVHPANSDITDSFKIYHENKTYLSFEAYLRMRETTFTDALNPIQQLDLYLLTPPINTGIYNFKIDILFSNGTVLTDTSALVTLR